MSGHGPGRHATRAAGPKRSGGVPHRAERPKIYCLTTHLEDNLCSRKLSLPSASPPWPPPHRPLFRPPTRNFSVQLAKCNPCARKRGCNPCPAKKGCNPCAARSKVGAPQGEQPYQTGNAGALAGVFLWRKLAARSASSVISRLPKTLVAERPTLKWTPLSLVFKRFLLRSYASARRCCALRRQHSFRGHDGIGDHLATADGRAGLRAHIFRTYLRRDLFRHPSGRGGRSHRHRSYSD